MISFASDNVAGAHPRLLKALGDASPSWDLSYGGDKWTAQAEKTFKAHFGDSAEVRFVFNGTAANVLGISTFLRPFECVLASEISHLNEDECGALERFAGAKIIALPTQNGKIALTDVERCLRAKGDVHRAQPRVLSITQSTECGTLYSPDEVRALAAFSHANGLILHMDGTRLSNAAAALGLSLKEMTADLGVDVVSYGGTKNGLVCGEAVVFLNQPRAAHDFLFVRKQGMQLASKMRFVAAQFEALLSEGLWLENARHANAMARRLLGQVDGLRSLELAYPSEANAVFAKIPPHVIAKLQKSFHFYVWNEDEHIVRWMTSFDTKAADVDRFAAAIAQALHETGD